MKVDRRQLRRLIERVVVDLTPEQQARLAAEREASKPRVYTPDEYSQARRIAHQRIEKYKATGEFTQMPAAGPTSHHLNRQRMHSPQAIETVMTMDTDSLINMYLGPMSQRNITFANVAYVLYDIVGMDIAEVLRSNAGQINMMTTMINETLDATAGRLKITPAIQNFFEKNMARMDSVGTPGFGHVAQNSLAVAAVKLQESGIDESLIITALEAILNKMSQPQQPAGSEKMDPNIVTY